MITPNAPDEAERYIHINGMATMKECQAAARLIAAAPDLLAALTEAAAALSALRKHYHKEMSLGYRGFVTDAEDAARAAIAKASACDAAYMSAAAEAAMHT